MAFETILIEDFSRGVDLVSSLNTIPPGFTPNARNFRLAEYGGIEKVQGYSAFATLGAAAHELTYYEQRDGSPKCLVAAEATAWQKVASDGTVTDIRTSMTTTSETTFVQHEDFLYGLDRENNLGRWDGAALTTYVPGVDTGPKRGIILGVWGSRMWVSPGTSMRVEFSDPETFTGTGSWPADQYVELGGPGTSDRIVGGVPTPDGLLVFTNRSSYLIYDDATGANRLVDSERGCSSRKSLVRIGDTVYGVCRDGVFATRGADVALISQRVAPLFDKGSPDLSSSAGVGLSNSYVASLARVEDYDDICVEVDVDSGSFMVFDYPAHAWARGELTSLEQEAYFVDGSDKTKVRRAFSGGSFAGSDISCYYETPLNPLGDETHFKRLRRVRVVGRGDITVSVKVDYDTVDRDFALLNFPDPGNALWDVALWDIDSWSGYQLFEGWASLSARGRRFTLRVSENSSAVSPPRTIFGETPTGSLGGCGAYLIEAHFARSSKRRQL